ncbi:MAG TPA: YaeQ family protein [Dongiaceae bacterium]|nr:YaeQ family protein [Dongiaceae bacterium]
MALKSTIFKADVQISNMDANYYANHSLTLAQHPSETEERLMLRLLAFMLHASERLEFGKGISNDDEAALWEKDLTDQVQLWIEVGTPDEKRVRKACHRAERVIVYGYGGRTVSIWWQQNQKALERFENLKVFSVDRDFSAKLEKMCERTMQLQCTIQDGLAWVSNTSDTLQLEMETLQ